MTYVQALSTVIDIYGRLREFEDAVRALRDKTKDLYCYELDEAISEMTACFALLDEEENGTASNLSSDKGPQSL